MIALKVLSVYFKKKKRCIASDAKKELKTISCRDFH